MYTYVTYIHTDRQTYRHTYIMYFFYIYNVYMHIHTSTHTHAYIYMYMYIVHEQGWNSDLIPRLKTRCGPNANAVT